MTLDTNIGFLGFGNMGQAILTGLLKTGVVDTERAAVFDVADACIEAARGLGVRIAENEADLAAGCGTLVLAVKPQMMDEVLSRARAGFHPGMRVISIAAGVSIAFLKKRCGEAARVVRVMPNTPALVGAGAAGIAFAEDCTDEDRRIARALFEAVGMAVFVDEHQLDAVTALSGSGPAYFFRMVECLSEAAVAEGLDAETASTLAAQTLLGAGRLLASSEDSAAVLRKKVTSKGGTTEAALHSFGSGGFDTLVAGAVHAAAARSRELGA